jgi:hypothetical protein
LKPEWWGSTLTEDEKYQGEEKNLYLEMKKK